jgi:hypothetical protein
VWVSGPCAALEHREDAGADELLTFLVSLRFALLRVHSLSLSTFAAAWAATM